MEKVKIIPGLNQSEVRAYLERLANIEYEQYKIREEQRRQAAVIAQHTAAIQKHDEQLERLEQRIAMAEREIAHYKPLLDSLRQQETELDNRVWYLESRGLPCSGYKKQLEQIREKAYRVETKVLKAQFDREQAERKMYS